MADSENKRAFIGLRDLTDAGMLATKRRDTEALRGILKREWALNREYYNGNQWTIWNSQTARVEALPVSQGQTWKIRLQSNQVKPGLLTYCAQLHKTRPVITAEPNSGGDTDVKAAQMATSLFEYLFDELNLHSKAFDATLESGLSQGYWYITWDKLAGKPMEFVMGPDGNPILDDELAEVYLDELAAHVQQAGGDPEEAVASAKQKVYLGDIRVDVMTAENVLVDPTVSNFEDAKWCITTHTLDPDEIQARWGVKVSPDACKTTDVPTLFSSIEEKKPQNTMRRVYIMHIKRCPALPEGRYVAWIEGPDQILEDRAWPHPFYCLPLIKWPGQYRPDSPYDDPITTEIRPLQKDFNKTLSQIVEHKNLVLRPQMLAPTGSLRSVLTSEPGAVFEFNPVANLVPQWREMPPVPASLYEHLATLKQMIQEGYHLIPSSRDALPARADDDGLLQLMQEATADKVSSVITRMEEAMAKAGEIFAALAKTYYLEPRLLRIRGAGGSIQVKKFMAADLEGGYTFRPRYGSGLPMSRAAKQQAVLDLVEAQVIQPGDALKYLDLGAVRGLHDKIAANEDKAFREHDKMLRGQPINLGALQQAQQQLQEFQQQAEQMAAAMQQAAESGQPMPDFDGDGVPDTPEATMQMLQDQYGQLQQQLQDAPWQPLDYEDWQAELGYHGDFMKTSEFERYPFEVQQVFIKHFNLTYQRWMEVMMASPDENHKTSVNVRAMGTVSAPVMRQILAKSGIDVSEDDVEAPPLDTQVIDTLEQPNVDESGNSKLTQLDQALTMEQAQDKHIVAMADAQQSMGLTEQRASNEQDKHQQALQHAQEKHDAQMAQQEQAHKANLHAKAQQAKAASKPKPAPAKKK